MFVFDYKLFCRSWPVLLAENLFQDVRSVLFIWGHHHHFHRSQQFKVRQVLIRSSDSNSFVFYTVSCPPLGSQNMYFSGTHEENLVQKKLMLVFISSQNTLLNNEGALCDDIRSGLMGDQHHLCQSVKQECEFRWILLYKCWQYVHAILGMLPMMKDNYIMR